MNFKKLASLMLVIVFALCSVSALATTEEEYEARIAELEERIADLEHQLAAKDYVAEFDGGHVTVEDAMAQYEYIQYMYYTYGYSMDGYEELVKQDIIDSMLEEAIVKYEADSMGFYDVDDVTAEEIMALAQDDLNNYISNYRSSFESEEATEEEIIAATTEYLTQNGITLDTLYEEELKRHVSDLVYAQVCDPVSVTDEDVAAKYDELVGQDQITYGAGGEAYEYALLNGTSIYWHPVGYRNVRQVLVAFDDDQKTRYGDITDLISSLEDELAAAQAPADEATEAPAEETTEEPAEETAEEVSARSEEEIQADLDEANAALAALYDELTPTVDEVYAKFEEGVSIDELISTYGGDPGSINDDGTTNTYCVSESSQSYDEPFRDAAMSIENIGELSEPANGSYGVYIVYYDSDVVSGPVDYEGIKDELYSTTLEEARTAAYDAQLEAWKTELNAVTYIENFR
jgi:hypothetical protein